MPRSWTMTVETWISGVTPSCFATADLCTHEDWAFLGGDFVDKFRYRCKPTFFRHCSIPIFSRMSTPSTARAPDKSRVRHDVIGMGRQRYKKQTVVLRQSCWCRPQLAKHFGWVSCMACSSWSLRSTWVVLLKNEGFPWAHTSPAPNAAPFQFVWMERMVARTEVRPALWAFVSLSTEHARFHFCSTSVAHWKKHHQVGTSGGNHFSHNLLMADDIAGYGTFDQISLETSGRSAVDSTGSQFVRRIGRQNWLEDFSQDARKSWRRSRSLRCWLCTCGTEIGRWRLGYDTREIRKVEWARSEVRDGTVGIAKYKMVKYAKPSVQM